MDALVTSARQAIAALLPSGHPKVERAARTLRISVRTLQRRLAGEGLCYSQLVDEVRLEIAQQRFADPKVKLCDLAAELGFADAGSFTRAFERWTGVAPTVYRRRMAGALDDRRAVTGAVGPAASEQRLARRA